MDFRQLQYIIQVAECGSITKAAAKLYITQPSLSNYISKLERELGVALFDRSVSPIRPTPAGEEYIKDAKRILYIQEQLEKKLSDLSSLTRTRGRRGSPYERGSRRSCRSFPANFPIPRCRFIPPAATACAKCSTTARSISTFFLFGRKSAESAIRSSTARS